MSSILKNCFAELLSFLPTKVTPGKNLTIPYPYNELKTLKIWKHSHPGSYWSLAASFNVPTQSWPCFSHTKRSNPWTLTLAVHFSKATNATAECTWTSIHSIPQGSRPRTHDCLSWQHSNRKDCIKLHPLNSTDIERTKSTINSYSKASGGSTGQCKQHTTAQQAESKEVQICSHIILPHVAKICQVHSNACLPLRILATRYGLYFSPKASCSVPGP